MAWLIKRRSGIWYKGERVNGKDRYTSLRTRLDFEAKKMLEAATSPSEPLAAPEGALEAKIQAFLRYLGSINLSHKTIKKYNHTFLHLRKHINSMEDLRPRPDNISESLSKYMAYIKDYAPATQGIWMRNLRAYLRWAGIIGYKGHSPESDLLRQILVAEPDEFRGRKLTDKEKELIFAASNTPGMERILRVLYASGLRIEQVIFLTWGQVIHSSNSLHVYKQKRQKERFIPMLEDSMGWVGKRPDEAKDSDRVFTNWCDYASFYVQWRTTLRRAVTAGLKGEVTPHTFRHTRASDLVEKHGFNAFDLLKFFGWSDLKLAERYVHTHTEDLRAKLLKGSDQQFSKGS